MEKENSQAIVPAAEDSSSTYPTQVTSVPIELGIVDRFLRPWLPGAGDRLRNVDEKAYQEATRIFEQDLAEKGISGAHELIAPAQIQRGIWSTARGTVKVDQTGFLLFSQMHGKGTLEGDSRTVSSVQFA